MLETELDHPEVAWLRERVPDGQEDIVHFVPVTYSASDLERAKDALSPRLEGMDIIGLGVDPARNAVNVVATPEDIAAVGGRAAFLESLRADLPPDLRDAVWLEEGQIMTGDSA